MPEPRGDEGVPFGRYALLAVIGHGGMGMVWRAWDTQLRRIVALKQLLPQGPDADSVERFVREARIAARLRHPSIVPVHDVGEQDGSPYFTADYIDGDTLAHRLKGSVPLEQSLRWLVEIARALQYAHQQGVVHRDMKPENVLIDRQDRAFVTDFGLAKEVRWGGESNGRPALTLSGDLLGTPRYMSPEQASGRFSRLGPASDQFSLGVMLYEVLTGAPPFRGQTLRDLLNAICESDPVPPRLHRPGLAADLETICLRALEKEIERRYADLGDLADDLCRVLDGEPIRARPVSAVGLFLRRASRRKPLTGAVAVSVTAVMFAVGWTWRAHERESRLRAAEQERARAESEAERLLEQGRPAIDKAELYLYSASADHAELVRQVELGQSLIERAIETTPRSALAHYLLGRCWELKAWEEKAEAAWRQALVCDARFSPARFRLGRILLLRSYLDGIVGTTGEQAAPELGRIGHALVDEAKRELRGAFEGQAGALFGAEERHWKDLADAYVAMYDRRWEEMSRVCRAALAREGDRPGSEEFHWLLGMSLQDDLQHLESALIIRPKYPEALLLRAYRRGWRGDKAGAMRDYDAALALHPRLLPALMNRGGLHSDAREWAEAEADFKAAAAARPDYPYAPAALSEVFREQRRYSEALSQLDRALSMDPRRPAFLGNRGNVFLALGDFERARADFDAALAIDPAHLPSLGSLAQSYLYAGEADRATELFQRLLDVADPAWPRRNDVQERLGLSRKMAMSARSAHQPRWVAKLAGVQAACRYEEHGAAAIVAARAVEEAGEKGEMLEEYRPLLRQARVLLAVFEAYRSIGEDPPRRQPPVPPADPGVHIDRAFVHLHRAFALDPDGARSALHDNNLAPLHADPRWRALLGEFGK